MSQEAPARILASGFHGFGDHPNRPCPPPAGSPDQRLLRQNQRQDRARKIPLRGPCTASILESLLSQLFNMHQGLEAVLNSSGADGAAGSADRPFQLDPEAQPENEHNLRSRPRPFGRKSVKEDEDVVGTAVGSHCDADIIEF
uniref:Uncharacterized protein n=1 Tax=Sphaerodactylus townsendi TaxID=933632 RepID=A0ACB8EGA6_9SAUR